MNKKLMTKVKPPWKETGKDKTWYETRPCLESLTDLRNINGQPNAVGDAKPIKTTTDKTAKDNRLKNWDKWLGRRKNQHGKFTKTSGREPCDLTMNSEQFVRIKEEDKELIAFAEELQIPDKDRGGPEYWGFPDSLKGSCSKGAPLFAQQTKLQKGILPEITKSGIPRIIKVEKNIIDDGRVISKKDFENSQYKLKRENQLKPKMDLLLHHKPDIDNLVVIGSKPKDREYDPYIRLPLITVNLEEKISETPIKSTETLIENIMALRINNTILLKEPLGFKATCLRRLKEEFYSKETNCWFLNFITTPYNRVQESVTIQNMGTVSIQYAWRKIDTTVSYMKKRAGLPTFFFEKNEGILIPGQEKTFDFWYASIRPQINREFWEFRTYPNFMKEEKLLTFKLSGITTIEPFAINKMKSFIDKRVSVRVAKDLLDYILNTFTTKIYPDVSYKDISTDESLFCLKNSQYFYHQKAVESLKALYSKIQAEFPDEEEIPWDLSIKTLRGLIIKLDLPMQNVIFTEFQEILQKLLKPTFGLSFDNKYTIVSSLLAKFFNIFEKVSDRAKDISHLCISAANSTKTGEEIQLYLSLNTDSSLDVRKRSVAHNNDIVYLLYKITHESFERLIFKRRILRHLQSTVECIDASLQSSLVSN